MSKLDPHTKAMFDHAQELEELADEYSRNGNKGQAERWYRIADRNWDAALDRTEVLYGSGEREYQAAAHGIVTAAAEEAMRGFEL